MADRFDPLVVAIDWLDAYRSADIRHITCLYEDDAVIECGCGGRKIVSGKAAIIAYWQQRLIEYPAWDLDDIYPFGEGVIIAYRVASGIVRSVMELGSTGKIARVRCGPTI